MPPNEYTCTICAATVSKRQSYAVEGGRACKTHQEAQQAATDRKEQEKVERAEHDPEKRMKETARRYGTLPWPAFRDPNTYCWSCNADGISQQEYFFRLSVLMEKAPLLGIPFNILFPSDEALAFIRKEIQHSKVIFVVESEPLKDWQLRQLIRKTEMQQIARMVGKCCICSECVEKFKLDPVRPKLIPLDTMLLIGSLVRPVVRRIAEQEIMQEGQALIDQLNKEQEVIDFGEDAVSN